MGAKTRWEFNDRRDVRNKESFGLSGSVDKLYKQDMGGKNDG